ncbi:hypothetical protein EC991_006796, partial [Linnemannia zychae]
MDKSTTSASQQPLSSSLPEDEQPGTTIAAPSTSSSKKQAPSTKKPSGLPTRERFTKQDMEFILTWMEHRPNFESVFGCGGQTVIGAPNKTKTHGYSVLAQAVTKQSKGRLNINGKAMRERFQRHMKTYTEAKRKADSTGFGVTEDDTRKSLYTVAHKLESMCTCYARMDALFGQRANITPLHEHATIVSAQGQDGCQDSSTAPRRSRRLIVEEEEEEEEDENEEEEENEDEGEEEERVSIFDEGGVINNIFGEDFNDLYDPSADNQGNSTRVTRGNDGDSVNDGADASAADDI